MKTRIFESLFLAQAITILLGFSGTQAFAGDAPSAEILCKEAGEYLNNAMLHYEKAKNPPEPKVEFNGSVINYSSAEYMQWGDEESARAAACFKKAADLEDAHGQYMYGSLLMSGDGVEKNVTKAAELFGNSANQGHPAGQFKFGMCFLNGIGRVKDDKEAVKWLKKSSDQGNSGAQEILGICYAKGQGVDVDFIQAYMLFSLSAASGNTESVNRRERIAKQMNQKQIEDAQRLSREWKPAP